MRRDSNDAGLPAEARALIAAEDWRGAAKILKTHVQSGRGGLLTRLALGRALLAAGDRAEALETLRETAALAPGVAETALALGEALLGAGHLPTAIAEFERAERLDPASMKVQYALGCAWLEAGEAARAVSILAAVAADTDFADLAREKIAEAEAIMGAPRAAPGYVRHLFDQFSSDYDDRMLGPLNYRAHLILRRLADMVVVAAPHSLAILDLGCGTGLTGAAFKDLARRLDGIDLSPLMIERARARGIYDGLAIGDVESRAGEDRYDLIVAADTLVYLGDLGPVLARAYDRLKPGGYFLFTLEKGEGDGYALGAKRRYCHGETYVKAEAARLGLDVMGMLDCSPRNDGGIPVAGLAVALARP